MRGNPVPDCSQTWLRRVNFTRRRTVLLGRRRHAGDDMSLRQLAGTRAIIQLPDAQGRPQVIGEIGAQRAALPL